MNPKVSVIMSVYNNEQYLHESIESILNQAFEDFEFIIADDGSTDGTAGILKEYSQKDNRIRLISHPNMGVAGSSNHAIRLSRSEYIARQDGDDVSLPERLEKEFDYLKANPEIELVASWVYIIDEHSNIILEKKLPEDNVVKRMLAYDNLISHSSVMYRKSKFFEYGCYDERYKYGTDTRLFRKMKSLHILKEPLLKYRWGLDNITHSKFCDKMGKEYSLEFAKERKIRFFSSLLIQQNEQDKARALLKKAAKSPRHFFYYLLTFLPPALINFYMWRLRYILKRILAVFSPYYRRR
ncbi:MAG: glycosyltransferase [Candidatus Omnitrophica bacterium]|nr:glycosyltransferase [Candidatus Omnitrophota bacterium]